MLNTKKSPILANVAGLTLIIWTFFAPSLENQGNSIQKPASSESSETPGFEPALYTVPVFGDIQTANSPPDYTKTATTTTTTTSTISTTTVTTTEAPISGVVEAAKKTWNIGKEGVNKT